MGKISALFNQNMLHAQNIFDLPEDKQSSPEPTKKYFSDYTNRETCFEMIGEVKH